MITIRQKAKKKLDWIIVLFYFAQIVKAILEAEQFSQRQLDKC